MMISDLNQEFGLGNALEFVQHASGLTQGLVDTPACRGSFFLLGAHLAEFELKRQPVPVLFLSEHAVYQPGKPIRGGVPICFPWFGPKADDQAAPAHGLVRTQLWQMQHSRCEGDQVIVQLGLDLQPYRLEFRICFGQALSYELSVTNVSSDMAIFEVALHSYFTVADIHQVTIEGLEQIAYRDKLTGSTRSPSNQPIRFTEETDRVYLGSSPEIRLRDPGNARTIRLASKNSASTVVWNPWITKSQNLSDFGDQEYLRMCCIETANVLPQSVQLAAGQSTSIGVRVSITDGC